MERIEQAGRMRLSKTKAPSAFHIMVKPRGAICNLDCHYCYYLPKEKLYPGADFRMTDALLKKFTYQYIKHQQAAEATFAWQGGEPTLMGLDFFDRAVRYQRQFARPGTKIHNTLQTNGVTLDDDWCRFFKQHHFLIGISIDGPRKLHDAYRVDKGGQPTFDRVMAGLELLKKHKVDFNILATVHAANADHPLQVYRFFRAELGARFIQFIPVVERDNQSGYQEGDQVTERSVTGEGYGRFLIAVFDEWVRRDVGRVFVQIFDVAFGAWMGQPAGLCIFAPTCGTALAMEHNGDIYSCDHFVEPAYLLGNIQDERMPALVTSDRQRQFGQDKSGALPQYCRTCPALFTCHGGCPKNRFILTPDGEPGLNYLCAGYKAFFQHVDQPMKTMATLLRQRRPPAEVMKIMDRAVSQVVRGPKVEKNGL